jgi:hypothetical protein
MAEVIAVTDELIAECAEVWRNHKGGFPGGILSVVRHLRKKYDIPGNFLHNDNVLLYGLNQVSADGKRDEFLIGKLIAIAPGLVLLNAFNEEPDLSGFLIRDKSGSFLFSLCPIFPLAFGILNLGLTRDYEPRKQSSAPITVFVEQGSSGFRIYIDESRWAIMKAWLDRWLPKGTEPQPSQ